MTNSTRATREAQQHLSAARTARNASAEAYALLALAGARGRQNDMPRALEHTRLAFEIAERLGEPHLLLHARNGRAQALRASSNFSAAIGLYLENLQAAERLGSPPVQRASLNGLAVSYAGLGDMDRVFEFATRAYAAAELAEDLAAMAFSANHLARVHVSRGDLAAARRFFTRELTLRQQLGSRMEIADAQEMLAMLDFREGRAAEALAALGPVEAQRRLLRGRVKLLNTLLLRAEILTHLGRLDEALECVEEARTYADSIEARGLTSTVYQQVAAVREARGEFPEALAAARRYFAAEIEVSGEAARQRAAELQTRFDVARKDEDLRRLARDNEVYATEARLRAAELAQNAAELRAAALDLSRVRLERLALAAGIAAATVLLGATVVVQRARLRAERRSLAETQRARAVAEEAASLKGQIVGIASHDLKAPLRAILTRTTLLEPLAQSSPPHAATLAQIRTDGERMLALVHDLLDVSAIESGNLTLRPVASELNALAERVVVTHRPLAENKRIAFSFLPSEAPLAIHADPDRLVQAIINLVDNALKFTTPGAAVRVSTARSGTKVALAVADEGPGLSAADLARMFQPFQTLSAVPTGNESSSGLGLHIAREIAERHGGCIDVDSTPGRGTTFTLLLPAAAS